MTDFNDAGYIILARYREENGTLVPRTAYGPYPTRKAAEDDNDGLSDLSFPTPEYNEILRLWTVKTDDENKSMLDVNHPIHEPRMKDAEFLERLMELASRVKLGMKCKVKIGRDHEIPNGRYYFQIACWRMDVITKVDGWGYGGKAYLSRFMTDSELFQIIFGLYKGYWEHEARENFEIDGVRPFGPHISTEALISVSRKVDVRSAKHVEDQEFIQKVSEGMDRAEASAVKSMVEDRDIPFDTRNAGMGSSVFDGVPASGAVGGMHIDINNPQDAQNAQIAMRQAARRKELS